MADGTLAFALSEPADIHDHDCEAGEIDLLAQEDPLLGDLYKEYQDNKAQVQELEAVHGADDPMVEVAQDMRESAWSAVQTRLIEVKENKILMERLAKHRREEAHRLCAQKQEKEREHQKKQTAFLIRQRVTMKRLQDENRPIDILEWAVLWLIFLRPKKRWRGGNPVMLNARTGSV